MPRIVESRFKQAAEAKKTRALGANESESTAKTKSRKLSTTAANESTFSTSRLGFPLTSSTPAPRKIASKINSKEKVSKNVSKSINKTTVQPVDRKVNEKLRAETARAKAEIKAQQLTSLIEKVKLNQLAARKVKLNTVYANIAQSKRNQKKIRERINKLESEMEKHLKITCDAEAFFELKAEREAKLQKVEAIMPMFDQIMVRLKETSPYLPIIQNSMIIELGNCSVQDLMSDLTKLDTSLVRLFNAKSEDEILEDLENMEKVKQAEVRIQELEALQEKLQKEIIQMKQDIAVVNYDPNEVTKTAEILSKPF